ncbi:blue copper protein 1a-like [Salvia miltiorrhiza]|uniref:blue copper protein 1a-like n=1 Tax=Salvia miltiorrhiza TaxID=226208 RepID=UPI0025ACB6E4|nr:blue copper protein 1a-like [Salvia miltiorrhiza]
MIIKKSSSININLASLFQLIKRLTSNFSEMALNALLFAAMMAAVAAPAFGSDFIVGDDAGWKLNVNYTAWAQGKQFHVGDRLIFKYTQGSHNVQRLSNAGDFQGCTISAASPTGSDIITLASPGRKWYACGVSDHCSKGMKLAINVISDLAPAPAPGSDPKSPGNSAANGYSGFMSWAWALAALVLHKIIIA